MSTPIMTPAEEYTNPFADPHTQESPKYTPGSSSAVTSAESGTPSNKADAAKSKKRVGFRGGDESNDRESRRPSWVASSVDGTISPFSGNGSPGPSGETSPFTKPHSRASSGDLLLPPLPAAATTKSLLPDLSPQQTEQIHKAFNANNLQLPRPRPAIRLNPPAKGANVDVELIEGPDDDGRRAVRQRRALEAFERGKRLEQDQKSSSEPSSRRGSMKSGKKPAILRTGE